MARRPWDMSLDHSLTHRRHRTRTRRPAAARTTRRLPRLRILPARVRLALLVLVVLVALLFGGWLWFRDSSFVRATRIQVTGVTSSAEPRIDAALDGAARG